MTPEQSSPLRAGTIIVVHNLRNRLFLPQYGLHDIPLMVSVVDIACRPYLRAAIERIGIKSYLGVSGPVIIDSGGFSFMASQNTSITVDQIVGLYRELGADLYAALDLPPAPDDSREVRGRKWRITMSNLQYMLKGSQGEHVIPIVHGHSLGEIGRACRDIQRVIGCPRVVGLGGMVPFLRGLMCGSRFRYRRANGSLNSGASFVTDAISICRAEFPSSHLHVFGAGSTTTAIALLALGAHSVDSLAWRRAAGYGAIFLAGISERLISHKKRIRESRPRITVRDHAILIRCKCPICVQHSDVQDRVNALGESYIARAVHNVWTLQAEQAEFRAAIAGGALAEFAMARFSTRQRFGRIMRDRLCPLIA